jgi:hypothetical protein
MTAQEQLTLRAVILHDQIADSFGLPAFRLLNDLGHDVSTTDSADQAIEMLQHDPADLLIIDAERAQQRQFISRLSSLPSDQQPKQVAVFSDSSDESMSGLASKLNRAKVHVLLRPLHMHGLLGMLRTIEQ